MVSGSDRSEIAFFDVETTVPTRPGQAFGLLEFGAILVCPRKLVELESYSTLLRPTDLSLISTLSVRGNGISKDAVVLSPTFSHIADRVYDILNGRIWAGHNILRFDCPRIKEAFAEIKRPPPKPKGTIDSLALLTQKFGRRAGDMKMATLATYFGLGQQTHRSLDDVRMNLEVLKYCATVLFLESSLPDIFTENSWVSPHAITRSRSNGKVFPGGMNSSSPSVKVENVQASFRNQSIDGNHPILSLMTPNTADQIPDRAESDTAHWDPFDLGIMSDAMERQSLQSDEIYWKSGSEAEASNGHDTFLKPDEVSMPSVRVSLVPFYRGTRRLQILHKDVTLQLRCSHLNVRFGINRKFVDFSGRPRLNFVVDATPSLCHVLDGCDRLAQRLSLDSGSSSEWRPVVTRKAGFWNSPKLRLQIPTVAAGNDARWVTEIYAIESSTSPQRLVFSRFDVEELDSLLTPGTFVDVYLSLDPYDYQQNAGIRLVAKKLFLNSN